MVKETKFEGWRCLKCRTLHIDKDEAAYCCAKIEAAVGWRCGDCEAITEYEKEAKYCCS